MLPVSPRAQVPPELVPAFEKEGIDLHVLFADGWGANDRPFKVANCGVFFGMMGDPRAAPFLAFQHCQIP